MRQGPGSAQPGAPASVQPAQPGAPASAQPRAPAFEPALATHDHLRKPQVTGKIPKYVEFRNPNMSGSMAMNWVDDFLEKRVGVSRKGHVIPSTTLNDAFIGSNTIDDINEVLW